MTLLQKKKSSNSFRFPTSQIPAGRLSGDPPQFLFMFVLIFPQPRLRFFRKPKTQKSPPPIFGGLQRRNRLGRFIQFPNRRRLNRPRPGSAIRAVPVKIEGVTELPTARHSQERQLSSAESGAASTTVCGWPNEGLLLEEFSAQARWNSA